MPLLFGPKTSRRDFLKTAGLSAGAVFAGGCVRIRRGRDKPTGPARWAIMADTHVSLDPKERYRNFPINENMRKAVAQIVEADVEGAVIDGDAGRLTGRLDDYVTLRELLKPFRNTKPVAIALGNHDRRENFRRFFRLHPGEPAPVDDKHILVIDLDDAGVRLIVLDSLRKVNETPGTLGDDQRNWLAEFLDGADRRPTLLFFHHPLTGRGGDLLDTKEVLDIIQPRRQVKAVFVGHAHVYKYTKIEDLDVVYLPAVAYNFSDKEPVGWLEARLTPEGGDFTLRTIGGNQTDNGRATSLIWRV